MRILESAPRRYDLGIRLLTLGGVDRAYDRLTGHIDSGQRVLDLGCGTGALAIRAALRGARVTAIDVDPRMLELAAERAREAHVDLRVELREEGVAELDREPRESYDAVTCGLCLSELSEDEVAYALEQAARLLKPGGLFLVADETRPEARASRFLVGLVRGPLVALSYLVTQQTTHALEDLPERLEKAGLEPVSVRHAGLGTFIEVVARRS
jgi:demethylmenaquinone methyltransferase/2-methoxy-6-polyprenyl-1,4-benzoquinol methylase